VRDAVVGVGRDWKPFVGIRLAEVGVVLVGSIPVALGVSLFAVSPAAGVAASLVGGLLSVGIILVGSLLLAFAGQSVVVDDVGFTTAVRRSAGFPFGQPISFLAYILVALGVFGGLTVFGALFGFLGVSQLSGIVGPLVAIPFLDAFKTVLYADRSFSPAVDHHQPSTTESAETAETPETTEPPVTDGGDRQQADDEQSTTVDQSTEADQPAATDHSAASNQLAATDQTTADEQPSYRSRFVAAFRGGVVELASFPRRHPVPVLTAAILFGLATVGGWQLTADFSVDLPMNEDVGAVFGTFPLAAFVMIAANNWLVSSTAIYGGVALGVPTTVDMLLNGFIVGAVYGVVDPLVFAALVAPHGVIELPAIIIAGGVGLHVAATVVGVFRGNRTPADLADLLRRAYRILLGLAVVLVVASFVEAFLTPAIAEYVLT